MVISNLVKRMSLEKFINNRHWDNISCVEMGLFFRALHTAIYRHNGQKRVSGGNYHEHLLVVADALYRMDFDIEIQVSALLHDVREDSDILYEELRKHFGVKVADIVSYLTKNELDDYWLQLEAGTSRHYETIFVKMVDRWHNLETVYGFRDRARQIRFLKETLGEFAETVHNCRDYVPEERLADYDELTTKIHTLATSQLRRVAGKQLTTYD